MSSYRIIMGDVKQRLQAMDAATFDASFCDPPYGMNFMNQKWDYGVPPSDVWQEVQRVLKPGAFLLAFGGTRTQHRVTCAIEDAGFEIRDCIMWVYGSGWPKSLDISKAIDKAAGAIREDLEPNPNKIGRTKDMRGGRYVGSGEIDDMANVCRMTKLATNTAKQWEGYKGSIKPAYEPCIMAMKPLEGTFAQNALKYGVAGLNIDACRITTDEKVTNHARGVGSAISKGVYGNSKEQNTFQTSGQTLGRWPANLIHDGSEEVLQLFPLTKSGAKSPTHKRHVPRLGNGHCYSDDRGGSYPRLWPGDSGSASRFFYCAKASRKERGEGNNHTCVKPIDLSRYLAKLLLPPKRETPRTILVPFSGSGSEMIGALLAGWDRVVGIEIVPEYVTIAKTRLTSYSTSRKVS